MPLRFKTSNIDVLVSYKKAGNALLLPKPPIRMKTENGESVESIQVVADKSFLWKGKQLACTIKLVDPKTQEEVPLAEAIEVLNHYARRNIVAATGETVKEEDIHYYAVQPDGSEVEVRPFERTQKIEVPEENWVPSTAIEPFLITNVYELFNPDEKVSRQLFEEAEKRLNKDQIGLATFSWGNGFLQYYVFLVPMILEGKFVWLLKLTDTKLEYRNLQDIPSKAKIPIREVPTLQTLPPVQALVVATTPPKKKKQAN